MRWGRIYIIPTESTLAVPPTCLQGAWHARSLQSKYAAAASSASHVRRWHLARKLEARLSRSRLALNLHLPAPNRTGNTQDAVHAAVIAHCSISAACSLRAPASLKTGTGDVRRQYGSLRFGYQIRRRPATERCTAGCDRGFKGVISKYILWIKFICTCEIVLSWRPQNTFDDKSTMVQVMAWCHQATSHYLCQCFPILCCHMASAGHNRARRFPLPDGPGQTTSRASGFGQIFLLYFT